MYTIYPVTVCGNPTCQLNWGSSTTQLGFIHKLVSILRSFQWMVCWWLLVHSHKHKKATKLIIAEIPNQAALMCTTTTTTTTTGFMQNVMMQQQLRGDDDRRA